jgi:membrane protein DedA with SNARE-associated domain
VFPGLHDLLSHLTYSVGLNNPAELGILYLLGIMSDVGVPLLLSLEIFLLFASYYIGPLSIQVFLIVGMLLLGRETGAAVLYWLSRTLGTPFLNWLMKHLPWLCRGMEHLKSRMYGHTTLFVVLVRLTPGFLQLPSFITGSLRLSYLKFAIGVAISSLIYDFGLVFFGFIAGIALKNAQQDIKDYFVIGFVVFIVAMWVVLYFRFRNVFNHKKA